MKLPPLREELRLQEGPRGQDGQPGWILEDPTRARFFRLDWLTVEIIQRWSLQDPELICGQISAQTPLHPTPADVEAVLKFLNDHQLLHLAGAPTSAGFARLHRQRRTSGWRWWVHHYLFFRVPLVHPEPFLRWLHPRVPFLFSTTFWLITVAAAMLGGLLAWRQWDVVASYGQGLTEIGGLASLLGVLVGVKVLHELGHGLAATRFGVRVPTMGLAFLVMTPMAYTDVNEAWKLVPRRPRLWIGAAGVLAELAVAAWATLAWCLLPDGALRHAAFLLAAVTWIKSLLINISPIMRFDGYYLLSDYLDLPNLHSRAFALARWRLRELLFDLGQPPPEKFPPRLSQGLIAFAWFVWIYRLIIFLGIAFFIYHFFFKAIGVLLFAIEILWFILLPICTEMKIWHQQRRAIRRAGRWRWSLAALVGLLALAAIPLPQRVRLSGLLSPQDEYRIVSPAGSQVAALALVDGAAVAAGQPLAELVSPELNQRLLRSRAREDALAAELAAASVDATQRARVPTLQASLATARATRREAETLLKQLQPVAPFAGIVRIHDHHLQPGDWLPAQELIATLLAPDRWQVTAFVTEADAHLIQSGARARFYPEGRSELALHARALQVESDASRLVRHPILATSAGGNIATEPEGEHLMAAQAIYRVVLDVAAPIDDLGPHLRRGRLVIDAGTESRLLRWSRNTLALLWREAGF
jgi:putative peptide zinc metalloprotease protein